MAPNHVTTTGGLFSPTPAFLPTQESVSPKLLEKWVSGRGTNTNSGADSSVVPPAPPPTPTSTWAVPPSSS